jgi:hypothetical protein
MPQEPPLPALARRGKRGSNAAAQGARNCWGVCMSLWSTLVRSLLLVVAAAGLVNAAAAQDGRAPVIVIGEQDVDPAQIAWLSENGRKALAAAIEQLQSGTIAAFVFAGSPAGDFWAYRSAAKASDPYSLSNLAHLALQSCEFFAKSPCYIASVSGKDGRDANGSLPQQPAQLIRPPAAFDASRIPFVSPADQRTLQAYGAETKARVLVLTVTAGWLWRAADNVFLAAATAFADCQKMYPNQTCVLYAVNDRVVFDPRGPY